MTRRNFIAIVSLCVVVALGLIVGGLGVFTTQSEYGQDALRHAIERRMRSSLNGSVYVGRIRGNFLTGVTIDSLEMRDDEDSLVVATGRISLEYDPRDLADRRLYFPRGAPAHPSLVLRPHENWKWDYRQLFWLVGGPPTKGTHTGFRGFCDARFLSL